MVRIRHFEFCLRSQGEEPTIEKFRAFYRLQSNLGFYSFATRGCKRLLINPPKSFHDWKGKFFYIHEEVIPVAMEFRDPEPIPKENLKIPKGTTWYERLKSLPNQAFGEQVLVVACMSDKWPTTSRNVPMLLVDGQVELYHWAFVSHAEVMGVRALCEGEDLWYDQIQGNFMYPPAGAFATPPVATGGAHIMNPCRAITPAGEDVVLLSSGESIASTDHGLNTPTYTFAGSLRNLRVDPEEKKPKRQSKKKKVIVAEGCTLSRLKRVLLVRVPLRAKVANLRLV
ncbi:hypothetical protein HanRHA438_Chr11g0497671 [Helianthus annuus]|uniref:Uncharacterized protein n=1 Tax=Helianthus annuus TaxID=4232 RepID=A0A9K3HN51_HELAN|nr:hypothetical protein HanXRQr2_Chr11g0485141 [Helianthus annuus]KAJ0501132.1 hypothetical protein HanHA300_Chr11g0397271 [Helianthus annuus]KAJ0508855.1 hypothetical protein HanIR_Chr11g0522001 [Helianthus annuus]KAJ0517026.1 hypothetical protein HanHA89_Chr11g0420561 [Helianthus annuus]KAJ0685035.1 hypothetical protein HanLR1_Chr11g0397981 [Helianthus annuus]